jgi:hypothetical protein
MGLFYAGILGVFALPFIAGALKRTPAWWVPGAVLLLGAVAMLTQMEDTHGDVGGVGAMDNGITFIGSCIVTIVGLIALRVGAGNAAFRRARAEERQALVTAKVVRSRDD